MQFLPGKQGSRYLVKDFSHPWLKSTRQRAKLKSRDRPASGTLPWTGKRMPTTMALRLQKDLLRIPSGCLRKSQPIAVSSPRLSASMARSNCGLFNKQEQAILAYTDAMTLQIQVPEPIFQALHEWFSRQEIVELTALIAGYNMVSRFLEAMQITVEGES